MHILLSWSYHIDIMLSILRCAVADIELPYHIISLNHCILCWHWHLLATDRWFWPPLLRSHPWLCDMIQKTGKTLGVKGLMLLTHRSGDDIDTKAHRPVKNGELRWCSRNKLDSRFVVLHTCTGTWEYNGIHTHSHRRLARVLKNDVRATTCSKFYTRITLHIDLIYPPWN